MKASKTGVVQHKQTKMSVTENNFLHSCDFSALTLVIKVRKPEHTVHPEVCAQKKSPACLKLALGLKNKKTMCLHSLEHVFR